MELIKLFDQPVLSYEMDYYQYLQPAYLMRLTATASFAALRDYGYNYVDLMEQMGATWMMGMVDMHVMKDLTVTNRDTQLALYASPLHRSPANFMLRVLAVMDHTVISWTDVCVMVVSFLERRFVPTAEVVEKLGKPANEIVLPAPQRLMLPEDMDFAFEQPVRFFDCDRNQHLNAYRYADYICQAAGYWDAGEHIKAEQLRIEYDSECRPGEVLSIFRKETEEGVYVKGLKKDGKLSFRALMRLDGAENAL